MKFRVRLLAFLILVTTIAEIVRADTSIRGTKVREEALPSLEESVRRTEPTTPLNSRFIPSEKGALISTGTFRAPILASMGDFDHTVILADSSETALFGSANLRLIKESEDRWKYLANLLAANGNASLFARARAGKISVSDFMDSLWSTSGIAKEKQSLANRSLRAFTDAVRMRRGKGSHRSPRGRFEREISQTMNWLDFGQKNFLADDDAFAKLKRDIRASRVSVVNGRWSGNAAIQDIGKALTKAKIPVSVLDLSFAIEESAERGDLRTVTAQLGKNLDQLSFTPNARVIFSLKTDDSNSGMPEALEKANVIAHRIEDGVVSISTSATEFKEALKAGSFSSQVKLSQWIYGKIKKSDFDPSFPVLDASRVPKTVTDPIRESMSQKLSSAKSASQFLKVISGFQKNSSQTGYYPNQIRVNAVMKEHGDRFADLKPSPEEWNLLKAGIVWGDYDEAGFDREHLYRILSKGVKNSSSLEEIHTILSVPKDERRYYSAWASTEMFAGTREHWLGLIKDDEALLKWLPKIFAGMENDIEAKITILESAFKQTQRAAVALALIERMYAPYSHFQTSRWFNDSSFLERLIGKNADRFKQMKGYADLRKEFELIQHVGLQVFFQDLLPWDRGISDQELLNYVPMEKKLGFVQNVDEFIATLDKLGRSTSQIAFEMKFKEAVHGNFDRFMSLNPSDADYRRLESKVIDIAKRWYREDGNFRIFEVPANASPKLKDFLDKARRETIHAELIWQLKSGRLMSRYVSDETRLFLLERIFEEFNNAHDIVHRIGIVIPQKPENPETLAKVKSILAANRPKFLAKKADDMTIFLYDAATQSGFLPHSSLCQFYYNRAHLQN